jgi:hypothetical protein
MHLLKLLFITTLLFLTGCAATVQVQSQIVSDPKLAIATAATKRIVMIVQGSKISADSIDCEEKGNYFTTNFIPMRFQKFQRLKDFLRSLLFCFLGVSGGRDISGTQQRFSLG